MKKISLSLSALFLLLFSNSTFSQSWVEMMQDPTVNFYTVQSEFNTYWATNPGVSVEVYPSNSGKTSGASGSGTPVMKTKKPGWKTFKRWEDMMRPRVYPTGDRAVMNNAIKEYLDVYYNMDGSDPSRGPGSSATPTPSAANWTLIGPSTTVPAGGGAGRINFVRFDPTTSNTIYVGSPGGGLWKSTTSGTGWTTNTDNLAVIGCTDIAINPLNTQIMYLATGDGDAQDTYSVGVLKSTNGGTTWNTTGLNWNVTNFRSISRLLINPINPNTIFAATSNGLYRSQNAGTSWTQIATALANIKDVEYRPGDTTTVYCCSTTRFYRSTNGGTTFTNITAGLPATGSLSRLAIAVTAANPAYVYVLGSNTGYGYQGLYRSTDNGVTFTTRSTTPNLLGWSNTGGDTGGQGWYDLALAVSPLNADHVLVGGINVWRSTNGGTGWTINAHWTGTGAPLVHADHHALEYLPGSGTTYFSGNDGGFFRTTNSGTSWTDLSAGLQIAQMYRIGCSATNANLTISGWQDNGTNRQNVAAWSEVLGGDGMESLIDFTNANVQYGELYYGEVYRTTTGGNLTTNIVGSGGAGVNADGDWVTPFIINPQRATTLVIGKAQAYRSRNRGTSWAALGATAAGTGNLTALAYAPSDSMYLYVAKYDRFFTSTNSGTSFTDRTAGLPVASAAITYIAVSSANPQHVWVTFSGYSAANKVWYSANAGVTWTNYSTGLPNLPANCIVYQNGAANDPLYVGTDVGVYYRDNTAGTWAAYNTGLPNVSVRELEIQYSSSKLRAGTFGRGLWHSDLYSPGASLPVADFTANRTNICVGDCINFTDLSTGSPTSWSWSFTGGTPATSTTQNPLNICYNTPGTYAVTLTATNINGSDPETKTAYITVSAPIALPLVEGFQGTYLPAGWYQNNPDADGYLWLQSSAAGGFGASTMSAAMDNYSPPTSIIGTVDEINTPKYNFSAVVTANMTFDVAYARYSGVYTDSLRVLVSTNCGVSWTQVYAKGGYTGLQTAPDNATSAFVPTAAQWRTENVSLTAYAGQPNVMVRFQNYSGWGQWLYLDNINITGTGGTPPPVANFSGSPTTVCAGQSVTFTDLSTNTPTSWSWTFPGGTPGTSTVQNPVVTYNTPGNYSVTLTATNAGGSSAPVTMTNYITVNPVPTLNAESNVVVCAGATVAANTFASTPAGATFAWTNSAPSIGLAASGTGGTPSFTAVNGTGSPIVATITITPTLAGCVGTPGTYTITVNPLPTVNAESNVVVCAGATVAANTFASTPAGATFAWTNSATSIGLAASGTGGTPSFTAVNGTGSPIVATITITPTLTGCAGTPGTYTITVNPLPVVTVNSPTICAGATATLTAAGGTTYSWSTGASTNPINVSPVTTTSYTVTGTTAGCSGTAVSTVTVSSLSVTVNSPTICSGANATLTAGGGTTYNWSTGASTNPITVSPVTTTSYTVTGTTAGCTGTAVSTVTVNTGPTVNAESNIAVCAGATVAANTFASTPAGATFAWTNSAPSIGLAASGTGGTPSFTAVNGTGSPVVATITITPTLGGCAGTPGTYTITVNPIPATPTASSGTPYCTGQTISLTTPAVAGATYSWTGPAAFTSTLQNPTRPSATTAMAGTYSVTVTVGGCTSAAGTTAVVVNTTPATPTAGSNSPVCEGSNILLTCTNVGGATYAWTGPNSYTAAVRNPPGFASTLAAAGTYSVTVTVGGCTSAPATTTVVVNPIPATPTAGTNAPVCTGNTLNLTTPTVAGATYAWTGPGGYTSTAQNPNRPSATPAMSGTYSVTITVAGCTSLAGTVAVVVNSTITPAVSTAITTGTNPTCAGSSVTFTATPGGGGATPTYQWQVNGSNVGTGVTYTSSTLVTGDIVTVIMTSSSSCASPTTATSTGITMTVNPIPATPSAGSNSPVCSGGTLNLTTPTVAGATYSWTGPSAYTSSLQNPSIAGVSAANAGTYSVTVTLSGCTSAAGTTAVIVSAGPGTPTAGSSSPDCEGQTISLTTPTVAGATYAWTGPGGYTSTTQNPTIASATIAMSGTYSVTVTVGGCTSAAGTTVVVVNPVPATPTASSTSPACTGTTLSLTTPTVAGATYAWTGPGGYTSSLQNPTRPSMTLAMSGTYSVTVTVGGCTSAAGTTVVTVFNTVTSSVVANITAGSNPTCAGASVTFTAGVTGGGTTPSYQWQVNGSNVGTGNTYTTSSLVNGDIVTVTLTSSNPCASPSPVTSSGVTMIVNPTVTPSVSIALTSGTNPACAGDPLTFTATPTNGGAAPTYQWQVNGVNAGTGGSTFNTSALNDGDIVTCILTSNAACASPLTATSSGVTMTITPLPPTPVITQVGSVLTSDAPSGNQWYLDGVAIPGATGTSHTIVANGDYTVIVTVAGCSSASSNIITVTTTGISSTADFLMLVIYPNPNDGHFNVSFNAVVPANYKIELVNAIGQLIFKEELKNFTGEYKKDLSVVDYGKGMYTISVINEKNEAIKKIIVY